MEQSTSALATGPIEWNGEAYHRLSDMQYDIAMEFLHTLEFSPSATILDAGCGSGRITREILARLPSGRILGVDLSHSMLETARQVVAPQPGQSAEFVQADLQTFVAPAAVDGIFSSMALHFVHDHRTLFANLAQTLRPGGWLAVQFGCQSQDQANLILELTRLVQSAAYAPYLKSSAFDFRGGDAASTTEHLQQAGFANIEISTHPVEFIGEYRDKMTEFFNTTFRRDCLAHMPEDLRPRFESDMNGFMEHAFTSQFEYLRVRAQLPQH